MSQSGSRQILSWVKTQLCRIFKANEKSFLPLPFPTKMSITTSSSSAFKLICLLHSAVALSSGSLMMFDMKGIYTFTHGIETATKLLGSSPHDQLLIRTSDSFSGLLLFAIGFLLFMVSFVKDKSFQSFFAKGCTVLHVIVAMWRFWFERRVEDLAWDWLRQTVGDILLGLSWVFFLVYSWREKYD